MHDTVLPMAFNSRPKVTFSDKGREDDKGEVQFTFGQKEDKTEDSSRQNSAKWSQMPDTATKATKGA